MLARVHGFDPRRNETSPQSETVNGSSLIGSWRRRHLRLRSMMDMPRWDQRNWRACSIFLAGQNRGWVTQYAGNIQSKHQDRSPHISNRLSTRRDKKPPLRCASTQAVPMLTSTASAIRPPCRVDAPTQFGKFHFWNIHLKRTNSRLVSGLCSTGLGHGVLLLSSIGLRICKCLAHRCWSERDCQANIELALRKLRRDLSSGSFIGCSLFLLLALVCFSRMILRRFPPFRNALDPPHSSGPTPSFH